jgi:hypothetical protein
MELIEQIKIAFAAVIVDYLQWKLALFEDPEITQALESYWVTRIDDRPNM